jgi:FixJ family two-component response regulator
MTKILVVDDNALTALHGAQDSSVERENEPIVVIVDDDDDVGEVLRGLLELAGYQVATYRSGREFLANANLGQVACLVVDQKMPEMTGLELLTQLSSRGITPPSLLITGTHDEKIARQALDLGVMKVMAKPMETGELLRFISFSVG